MYKIEYDIEIEKVLKKLPKRDVKNILDRIQELAKDPRALGTIKLSGRNAYRARVGNYRIIYHINDKHLMVIVIDVDNRGTVYKKH